MGRIGYDDLLTRLIATRTMIVVDGHQSRQFSVGTRIRLEGEVCQTREGTERPYGRAAKDGGSGTAAGLPSPR